MAKKDWDLIIQNEWQTSFKKNTTRPGGHKIHIFPLVIKDTEEIVWIVKIEGETWELVRDGFKSREKAEELIEGYMKHN